ncbi:MAG: hypothetical protein ACK5MD_10570 [Flavobacteriales bacterium]
MFLSIFDLKEVIDTIFTNTITEILVTSKGVLDLLKYIALGGVFYRIVRNFIQSPNNWFGYVSYIPLAILLFNYYIIIDFFVDFGKSIKPGGEVPFSKNWNTMIKDLIATGSNDNGVSLMDATIGIADDWLRMLFLELTAWVFLFLGMVVSSIVYLYLKFKVLLKFIFLSFFGVLNLSLSFIPDFQGSYKGWIMSLLEVSLYLPMLYVVDTIGVKILDEIAVIINASSNAGYAQFVKSIFAFSGYLIIIMMYLSIPKIVMFGLKQGSNQNSTIGKVLQAGRATLAAKM